MENQKNNNVCRDYESELFLSLIESLKKRIHAYQKRSARLSRENSRLADQLSDLKSALYR